MVFPSTHQSAKRVQPCEEAHHRLRQRRSARPSCVGRSRRRMWGAITTRPIAANSCFLKQLLLVVHIHRRKLCPIEDY